jgi:DNA-directed RNA polymerase specialized sigma24 family protein
MQSRFNFLSPDAFSKLSQAEKLNYLARAAEALGKTTTAGVAKGFADDRPSDAAGTLGAVLYSGKKKALVSEKDWVELVRSVAAGDPVALHGLYQRTNRLVFTLIMRIIGNREIAEEFTLAVFYDVWLHAPHYDAEQGTVLAWIMNYAQAKAIDGLCIENRKRAVPSESDLRPTAGIGDILSPRVSLQDQLARCVSKDMGKEAVLLASQWHEPEWEDVAPKISCKLLATDTEKHRVSMLVRLAPGGEYPPHTHAGVEELHLLAGELWIDHRKLYPGDYNRAEPGTGDKRVWSQTGCTCVLVTSIKDILA